MEKGAGTSSQCWMDDSSQRGGRGRSYSLNGKTFSSSTLFDVLNAPLEIDFLTSRETD